MAFNLLNLVVVKVITERQGKTVEPGLLIASALLPGPFGIAIPLIAAKNAAKDAAKEEKKEVLPAALAAAQPAESDRKALEKRTT